MILGVQLSLDGGVRVVGARPDDDFYRTPRWLVDAVLERVRVRPRHALDAGAGDGVLGQAVSALFPGGVSVTAVELDPERAGRLPAPWDVHIANFLTWAPACPDRFDLIVTNPPFNAWDEFVLAALPLLEHGGTLLALGFTNVLGGQDRFRQLWQVHPPSTVWLSPRRASFTEDGKTDARDVVWIEWRRGGTAPVGGGLVTRFGWLA